MFSDNMDPTPSTSRDSLQKRMGLPKGAGDTENKKMKLEENDGEAVVADVDDGGEKVTGKDGSFKINTDLIQQASLDAGDESELQNLGLSVFNQDEFEEGIMQQVDQAIAKDEAQREKVRLTKELKSIEEDIKLAQDDLARMQKSSRVPQQLKERKLSQLKTLRVRQKMALRKLREGDAAEDGVDDSEGVSAEDPAGSLLKTLSGKPKKESDRERMVRLGQMTPFGTVIHEENSQPAAQIEKSHDKAGKTGSKRAIGPWDHAESMAAGASDTLTNADKHQQSEIKPKPARTERPKKPRNNFMGDSEIFSDEGSDGALDNGDSDYAPSDSAHDRQESEPDSNGEDFEGSHGKRAARRKQPLVRKKNVAYRESDDEDSSQSVRIKREHKIVRERDDADETYFRRRLLLHQQTEGSDDSSEEDEEFDGGLVVPGRLWKKLYKYQRIGVRWLWELHCQQAGGIVGDEMGLGKTIQMIAFLAAMKHSKLRHRDFPYMGLGPTLIVCPTTVMHQWVKEFHTWAPEFRVAILHSSGSYSGSQAQLVRSIVKSCGVIVTSFNTLVIQQDILLPYNWHYIVLDEGHKIRNPDAQVTLCCKQFRTAHRIILSGSPIQNNLKELWSLFDFVFPGKLGTLPDFMAHFSVPIVQGGYANATQVQVETAYKCACILRDTINPYMLRRMKADVKANLDLPNKSEQVLFCRLTDEQREVYEEYLQSREVQAILAGKFQVFAGLITLRKICNHPDLSTGGPRVLTGQDISGQPELHYGYWRRSGKMIVVEALLKLWHRQGHRVLLFTQSRAMLDVIEDFVQDCHYTYLRMDGATGISARQPLIAQYNRDPNIFLFLLTTRVGGLGVNLTGANRVLIYDPDWNPSTDTQARERAWRIGQKRQVTVYRLLTSGTIEEKIYHRQIFKQFLTNRVLKDPRQRRFFKSNDIFELFTLGSRDEKETETSAIFAGTGSDVKLTPRQAAVAPVPTPKALKPNRFDEMRKERKNREEEETKKKHKKNGHDDRSQREKRHSEEETRHSGDGFSGNELERMRELARKLSQQMEKDKQRRLQGNSEGSAGASDVTGKDKSAKDNSASGKDREPSLPGKPGKEGNLSLPGGSSDHVKHKPKTGSSSDLGHKRKHHSDSSRDKDRKRKKRKDAKFEGERIPHLVKSCSNVPRSQDDDEAGERISQQQDDYVLRTLFKKTGIHGVMKHDKIMDSGHADYALVEAEAVKVAKEAAAALKRSRSMCLSATSGIPTWTGQHGGTAAKPRFGQKKNSQLVPSIAEKSNSVDEFPAKKERFVKKSSSQTESLFDGSYAGSVALSSSQGVVSSSELLSRMQRRQRLSVTETDTDTTSETNQPSTLSTDVSSKDQELMEDIRNFIAFMSDVNGQASTQELLTNFGPRLPKSDSAKFKAMLMQICEFHRIDGIGTWKLKPEFR